MQSLIARLKEEYVPGSVIAVAGPNFSGRTDALDEAARVRSVFAPSTKTQQVPMAYVGPEVYHSLSGLALTVRDELRLHAQADIENTPLISMAENLGLIRLYHRSPFTLSGGEQACLAIVAGLALNPAVLAIDCAAEQIDPELKRCLLNWLQADMFSQTVKLLADNRLSECGRLGRVVHTDTSSHACPPSRPLPLRKVTARDVFNDTHSVPCQLTLRGLRLTYPGGTTVLQSANVILEPGKIYFLRGRVGAGKTTLAKILNGVLRPTAGEMHINGKSFQPWKEPGRVVSYHFQNPDLQLFSRSVQHEIETSACAHSTNPAWRFWRRRHMSTDEGRRIETAITAFGLENIRHEHPMDLPFVIRKRVALAATISASTPWIILDEPTLGQDHDTSKALIEIMLTLSRENIGVIVISHSQWLSESLPHRRLLIHDGVLLEH